MSLASGRTRIINPRLGIYFGIFTSLFLALCLVLLILGQLDVAEATLGMFMLICPVVIYVAIGVAGRSDDVLDYFAAGRRVPAFYAGIGLAMSALGATGLMALTGAIFITGFDALCIGLGVVAGFVLMAVLVAPFVRKTGTFTLPSFFMRRFESRTVRLASAMLMVAPVILVLAAEIRAGAFAASFLSRASVEIMVGVLALVLMATVVAGGARSLTWSSTGQCIAAVLALIVPVAIVAVFLTNMPVPQLSHGPVLRALGRSESVLDLPKVTADLLAFNLPGEGLQPIAKRFANPFGSVGPLAFLIAMLTTAAGIASAPWLLPRLVATPSVYEVRKGLGWATITFGIVLITLASIAVFMREYLFDIVTAAGAGQIPGWLQDLSGSDLAGIDAGSGAFKVTNFTFERDGILLALPMAGEMPSVMLDVVLAGLVAAALACAGAAAVSLGTVLAEDVVDGLSPEPTPDHIRVLTARAATVLVILIGAAFAAFAPTDSLRLFIWALVLSASSLFPVLVLSIWWKRTNAYGALAGLLTGFCVAVLAILAAEAQWLGIDSALAGLFGIPASFGAALSVTMLTPLPGRNAIDLVSDLRIPGGETLYDREMRLQRQRQRQRG